MKISKINKISKVQKESGKSGSGSASGASGTGGMGTESGSGGMGSGTSGEGSGAGSSGGIDPSELGLGDKKEKEKGLKGPGKTTLSEKEKLPEDYMKTIENAIQRQNASKWDVGEVTKGDGSGKAVQIGPDGKPIMPDEEHESREWGDIEKKIDQATRDVLQNYPPAEREGKSQSEKGKGGGTGGFRDRLQIETIAKTDWAKIFETRLTAYSRERATRIPYHRKFVGNKMLRTRITSKTQSKDTLPETNVIIDTSSSLSYRELEVILAELQKALEAAKIKKLNLILWESEAYFSKSYTNVDAKTFNTIIRDVNDNWRGGGNDIRKVYKLMKEKGWIKKFTIHLTDGWISSHKDGGEVQKLSNEVLDPNNTIFGIIYPHKTISMSDYRNITDRFPGEKVPIFLDTDKFY